MVHVNAVILAVGLVILAAALTTYPTATMLSCTALSAALVAYPVVMTPSKKVPEPPGLLSPPMPRMMPPWM